MSSGLPSFSICTKFDHFVSINKYETFQRNPSNISTVMWKNIAKVASVRGQTRFLLTSHSFSRTCSFIGFSQDSIFPEEFKVGPFEFNSLSNTGFPQLGFRRIGEFMPRDEFMGRPSIGGVRNQASVYGLCPKSYASVAEAVSVSSTDAEEDVSAVDEVQELLEEMGKEERRKNQFNRRKRLRLARGMGIGKYQRLRRRQVKIETEAWEQAAKEYRELLADMCKQKLAPNLPYMKSLFLGWFEPLRDKIVEEQELFRQGKNRAAYAPYIDQLPADKMSVITMHKLMGLLMTGGEHSGARVVHAACSIGDAIEQEVRIHRFLEKTNKKKVDKNWKPEAEGSDTASQEHKKVHKTVTNLMKKQKLHAVRKILKEKNESKPWHNDAKAKVGGRLIELLIQTAYIQPPADQLRDGPPDIRPAFVHTFRNVTKETQKTSKRFGIIQCDPLVLKGLERTVSMWVGGCVFGRSTIFLLPDAGLWIVDI